MAVIKYRRRCMGALLMGVIGMMYGNTHQVSFSPPFSDASYTCRCRPSMDDPFYKNIPQGDLSEFHLKVCELKRYMRDFEHHMQFFKCFFQDPAVDVVDWFSAPERRSEWFVCQSEQLKNRPDEMRAAFKKTLAILGGPEIVEKIRSQSLKSAFNTLVLSGSFEALGTYWDVLKTVVDEDGYQQFMNYFSNDLAALSLVQNSQYPCIEEQCIACAYMLFKDLIDCMHMLSHSIDKSVRVQEESMTTLLYLAHVYAVVNALPISATLREIDCLMEQLVIAVQEINAEFNDGFDGWLKSKWITFPLSIGIIIVKVVYYLLTRNDIMTKCDKASMQLVKC